VILVLLDFSKAFDSVDHDLLCHKLERFFDFSSSAVGFIRSYLNERSQCVSAGEVLSGFLPVLRGVPQGTVLSPLLSTLFINDLCRVVQSSQYHIYADDISFMLRMTSLTSHLAWNVSILILTRFIAGQLTMVSFSMARKHRL
jgi:hypothetical protein